jgi:hypothetical protein
MNLSRVLSKNPRLRLVLALLVAAAYSDVLSVTAYRRAWRAFKAIFGLVGEPTKTGYWYFLRMETCKRCPIYFSALSTCGSPLLKEWPEAGCWCFLPLSARDPEKQCWLDEELGLDSTHGWNAASAHPQKPLANPLNPS